MRDNAVVLLVLAHGSVRDVAGEAIPASFVHDEPIAPSQIEPELLVGWRAAVPLALAEEKITRTGKPLRRCTSPA